MTDLKIADFFKIFDLMCTLYLPKVYTTALS